MPNRSILLSKLRNRPPLSIRRRRKDFEKEKRSLSFASYDLPPVASRSWAIRTKEAKRFELWQDESLR